MTSVNVFIFGFGDQQFSIRERINAWLQKTNNAHGSVTTMMQTDVKCAEHPKKDEPYLQVYSDDEKGGEQIAEMISNELKVAVEFILIKKVFLPQ